MAVLNSSKTTSKTPTALYKLLNQLIRDYPDFTFAPAESFYWSPRTRTVAYASGQRHTPSSLPDTPSPLSPEVDTWSLLHELGHGVLGHKNYRSDFELVQLEVAAWDKAVELAQAYQITIDEEHVQDCLDTYRDWLHRRSTCPTCHTVSLQRTDGLYACFNCAGTWSVSSARFCRAYRKRVHHTKKK